MEKFRTTEDVLRFAISMEQMAFEFYRQLSGRADADAMRELLRNLADEETLHKHRLEKMMGKGKPVAIKPAMRKEIGRHLDAMPVPQNITLKEAIKIAIQKEHSSMTLYTILAGLEVHKELQELLVFLAQEEASHKFRFQEEYHRIKLQEN